MQCHYKKCFAPHFVQELHEDICKQPFSLLLDESTDIRIEKYLGCTIIYYSLKQKQLINSFLDLCELGAMNDSIVAHGHYRLILNS
jgi:hypothetical protein